MADNHVHIITDCGPATGSGHLQRMMLLTWYLNHFGPCNASLQVQHPYPDMPEEIIPFITDRVHPRAGMIIRDMRDSSRDEITELEQHAPVIVIDDEGEGAEAASQGLYLLPRPGQRGREKGFPPFFLYGYGLYTGMKGGSEPSPRDIHLSIYTGKKQDHPYTEKLLSLLPRELNVALLQGEQSRIITGNYSRAGDRPLSYTALLQRSRCVMSHFGILLYEAHLCGCHLVSVNPTGYHAHLAGIAPLPVNNMGVIDSVQKENLEKILTPVLTENVQPPCSPGMVIQRVHENLESFVQWLTALPFYR